MERPDVVEYLRRHLKSYKVEDLRQQLASEGVGDDEFRGCLEAALRPVPKVNTRRRAAGRALMALAALGLLGALVHLLGSMKTDKPKKTDASSAESAFVGHSGYVIRLPKGYAAVQKFQDSALTDEVVHFCKEGSDPTSLIDKGLFGPLGIVRLEAQPNPFGPGPSGLQELTRQVTSDARQRGDKFTIKNVQVSSLNGIQLNFDVPNPHVECYVLGQNTLYYFYAGQDDDLYRGLLNSLRDPQSENYQTGP